MNTRLERKIREFENARPYKFGYLKSMCLSPSYDPVHRASFYNLSFGFATSEDPTAETLLLELINVRDWRFVQPPGGFSIYPQLRLAREDDEPITAALIVTDFEGFADWSCTCDDFEFAMQQSQRG